jgi:hypothetical protein
MACVSYKCAQIKAGSKSAKNNSFEFFTDRIFLMQYKLKPLISLPNLP